jgi:DNA mismatch endonuclease (patch repair protein)
VADEDALEFDVPIACGTPEYRRASSFMSKDVQFARLVSRNSESPEKLSARMSAVRRKGTAPELVVRRILTERNIRFSTDVRTLPGRPDIANKARRFAIFVHGCFWHRHPGCPRATVPASNIQFWEAKFQRTLIRDQAALKELRDCGFDVLLIWECETRHLSALDRKLDTFISKREP